MHVLLVLHVCRKIMGAKSGKQRQKEMLERIHADPERYGATKRSKGRDGITQDNSYKYLQSRMIKHISVKRRNDF